MNRPFPLLAHFLSKVQPQPVMMPARIADATDPFKRSPEVVGCGPSASSPTNTSPATAPSFARFDKYTPRQEPASYTAGGHKVLPPIGWSGRSFRIRRPHRVR